MQSAAPHGPKGLRRLSKTYGCRVRATSTRCRGLWNSTCSKVRRPKITRSMPPTPYGRAGPRSRLGPDPRPFGPLTRGPERTSPSTSAIPNSRALRSARPSALARRQTSLESRPSLHSRQISAGIGNGCTSAAHSPRTLCGSGPRLAPSALKAEAGAQNCASRSPRCRPVLNPRQSPGRPPFRQCAEARLGYLQNDCRRRARDIALRRWCGLVEGGGDAGQCRV